MKRVIFGVARDDNSPDTPYKLILNSKTFACFDALDIAKAELLAILTGRGIMIDLSLPSIDNDKWEVPA